MPQKPEQPPTTLEMRADVIGFFSLCVMTSLIVFTRTNFGRRALRGMSLLFAAAFIIGYGAWAREPLMWPYFWGWVAALVFQRIRTEWLLFRGARIYSYYWGDRVALLEPALCLLGGPLLWNQGIRFGGFLVCCGVAIALVTGLEKLARMRRLESLRDGEMENDFLLDEYYGR